MSKLVALFVLGYRDGMRHLDGRILRELGRLPDHGDVAEAERVLDQARSER